MSNHMYKRHNAGAGTPPVIFYSAQSFSSNFDRATYEANFLKTAHYPGMLNTIYKKLMCPSIKAR